MPLQFSVEISPAQVREATAGIFWRQVTQWRLLLGIGALMGLAQATLWAVLPQAGWVLHAMLAVLLIISAVALGAFASRYYQELALRNFQRLHGQPVQVELDEEAYRYQAQWGRGSIPWATFESLWRFPSVWVLLQHAQGGVSVLLPTDGLDEAAQAHILRKLGEHKAQGLA